MRIALLGAAHWHAAFHADAIRQAGAELDSVWDPDPHAAARIAAQCGGVAVASVDAALARRPALAVAMGTGPQAAALLGQLLGANQPVLAEKPVGLSAADVLPLARYPVFAAAALPHRLGPIPARLAALRARGQAGRLGHMRFRLINGPPGRYRDWGVGWMLEPAQSGGGALRNLGLHGIDAFLALAGAQPVTLVHAAFGPGLSDEKIEDYALLVLRARDGTLGLIEAGYTHPDPAGSEMAWSVTAAGATLHEDGTSLTVTTATASQAETALPQRQRYAALMADTLARLRDGRPPLVGLADLAAAMAIADAAYAMTRAASK